MTTLKSPIHAFVLLFAAAFAYGQDATAPSTGSGLPAGVSLPRTGMVYVFDGAGELIKVHPTEILSNSHAAGNMARGIIYAGPRATVELQGLRSEIHLNSRQPLLYVRLNLEEPDLTRRQIHLIRLEQTKDRRVVLTFGQNVFGGHRSKHYDDIAIDKADAEPDVWLKITPSAPLAPGEYGIVLMPSDVGLSPDTVYDFDVDVEDEKPGK